MKIFLRTSLSVELQLAAGLYRSEWLGKPAFLNLLLARSLYEPAHLHIWEEPMNHIDVISRLPLEQLLLQYRPTIIFVEHDKAFAQNVATKNVALP